MPTPKKGPRLGGSGSHQKHMLANLAKGTTVCPMGFYRSFCSVSTAK